MILGTSAIKIYTHWHIKMIVHASNLVSKKGWVYFMKWI